VNDINFVNFFSNSFIFKGIDSKKIDEILNVIKPTLKAYKAKEVIYSPSCFEKNVGFVVSGECLIERVKSDGTHVPLNIAKANDAFGITAALTDEEEFPTRITAKKETKVIFLTRDNLSFLIEHYNDVAKNVIFFLSNKIVFLNKKIATFSSSTVEEKLASYLLMKYSKIGKTEFPFNCKKASESINSGRASLYRAISSLSEKGIISLVDKKIIILDQEGLERITK
jgi:CRP-like cAMP-binding protein